MIDSYIYKSPIGMLNICEEDGAIVKIDLENGAEEIVSPRSAACSGIVHSDLIYEAYKQLEEYFAGNRRTFDLPVRFGGTQFQQRVWRALQEIPYGETRSYQDIAVRIENEKAVRAVGQANHNNHILIVVPCHRVINKNGSLGGFGGGLDVKRYLLELERSNSFINGNTIL